MNQVPKSPNAPLYNSQYATKCKFSINCDTCTIIVSYFYSSDPKGMYSLSVQTGFRSVCISSPTLKKLQGSSKSTYESLNSKNEHQPKYSSTNPTNHKLMQYDI